MTFGNPIASGDKGSLVRDSLQSRNFNDGTDGNAITGWQIARDGTATFTGLNVGGDNASIDSDGNATFATLSVTDTDITIGGQLLIAEVIAQLPLGVIGYGEYDTATGPTSAELGLYEISIDCDAARQYRLTLNEWFTGTVANDNINFRVRDGGASTPTLTSTIIYQSVAEVTAVAPRVNQTASSAILTFTTGQHRLLVTVRRDAGTGTVTVSGSPDRPCELFVEDMGPVQSNIANPNAGGGGVTPVQNLVKTYNAVTEGWYDVGNSLQGAGKVSQGDYASPGANGNTRGIILFPFSTIQSDLTGATITKCELYLYYTHWYFNAGGTAIIGTHNGTNATLPSNLSTVAGINVARVSSGSWPNPGGRWVSLGTVIGNEFKTGGGTRGIIIGPAQTNTQQYYGYTSGIPQLRISYTK